MCSVSVPCPLCSQTSFANIDSLRISLIKAANGPLTCPLCTETVLGLDKLTIHLFSHTNLLENNNYPAIQTNETSSLSLLNSNSSNLNEINSSFQISNSIVIPTLLDNNIRCDVCELTFRSVDLLNLHYKLIHQNLNDDNQNSNEIKKELQYQCHLCPKAFKMKGSLRVHLKVVHLLGLPIVNNVPKLSICDKIRKIEFKEAYTMSAISDIKGNVSATSIPNIQVSQPVEQIQISLSPMEPQQSINYNGNTSSHIVPHINNQLNTKDDRLQSTIQVKKGSNLSENYSNELKGIEIGKPWECDVCSKSFTTKYFLKKHKRLHTGEMPYTCEICGKTFTFQQSYHKHLLYHSDEKPHSCQTCGRSFKELSTLHNHERIHSGEKPFKCEICDKCFRQRVSYLVHKRIHTGVMPYKCLICQKSFRYKVSQRTHKCISVSPSIQSSPIISSSNNVLNEMLKTTEKNASDDTEKMLTNNLDDSTISVDKILAMNEEMLTKSIDDFVVESCNKMGIIGSVENLTIMNETITNELGKDNVPSPTDKFQNLCLYSPASQQFSDQLETINEDSFKKLLYGDDHTGLL